MFDQNETDNIFISVIEQLTTFSLGIFRLRKNFGQSKTDKISYKKLKK